MAIRPIPWLVAGYVVAVAGLAWYVTATGEGVYASTGDSYPGGGTALAEPLGYFTATLAGALSFGGLMYVLITSRPDARGVIDERAFRAHLLVERASALWALTALAMVAVQAASDAGAPVVRLFGSGSLGDAILASEMARAWIAVAVVALIVTAAARLSVRWVTHVVLLVPAVVGVVAAPVSGNAGQGPDHDYATSAAIVFAVALAALVGLKVVTALWPPQESLNLRVQISEIISGAIVLAYGAMLLASLLGPGGLTDGEAAEMERLGEQISMLERRAMEAERDTVDRYVAAYLSERVGEVVEARITGVLNFGFFATVEGIGGDGLMPARDLGREYFRYDEAAQTLVGEETGTAYAAGQRLRLRLAEANPVSGALRFELLPEDRDDAPRPRKPGRPIKRRGRPANVRHQGRRGR